MKLIKKINNVDQWLVVLGIFAHRLEVIFLLIILIILIYRHKTIFLSKRILISFTFIFITSMITISLLNYDFAFFFRQFFVIFFYFTVYNFFFQSNKYDLINVFSKYIKICYLVSILGLVQFTLYIVNQFNIFSFINKASSIDGTQFSRISSITSEPSNLAILLTPAIVYYLLSNKSLKNSILSYKKKHFFIIFITAILTFSSIFYLILVLIMIFKITVLKKNKLIKYVSIIMIIFLGTGSLVSKQINFDDYGVFKNNFAKIFQTLDNFTNLNYESFEDLNASTFATLVNLSVAVKSPNRITGSGLGTHEQNYLSIYPTNRGYVAKNMKDAYSMGIRIFSEFGFLGLVILLLFFIIHFNKSSLINMSVLFLLISLFLRGGNFVLYGVIFFLFMYYNTRLKNYNKNKIFKPSL